MAETTSASRGIHRRTDKQQQQDFYMFYIATPEEEERLKGRTDTTDTAQESENGKQRLQARFTRSHRLRFSNLEDEQSESPTAPPEAQWMPAKSTSVLKAKAEEPDVKSPATISKAQPTKRVSNTKTAKTTPDPLRPEIAKTKSAAEVETKEPQTTTGKAKAESLASGPVAETAKSTKEEPQSSLSKAKVGTTKTVRMAVARRVVKNPKSVLASHPAYNKLRIPLPRGHKDATGRSIVRQWRYYRFKTLDLAKDYVSKAIAASEKSLLGQNVKLTDNGGNDDDQDVATTVYDQDVETTDDDEDPDDDQDSETADDDEELDEYHED